MKRSGKAKANRLMGLSVARAGNPQFASYEQTGDFNSQGTKRAGDPKFEAYPADMQNKDGNPGYKGGVCEHETPKSRRG